MYRRKTNTGLIGSWRCAVDIREIHMWPWTFLPLSPVHVQALSLVPFGWRAPFFSQTAWLLPTWFLFLPFMKPMFASQEGLCLPPGQIPQVSEPIDLISEKRRQRCSQDGARLVLAPVSLGAHVETPKPLKVLLTLGDVSHAAEHEPASLLAGVCHLRAYLLPLGHSSGFTPPGISMSWIQPTLVCHCAQPQSLST